jgi:hypothetical protein
MIDRNSDLASDPFRVSIAPQLAFQLLDDLVDHSCPEALTLGRLDGRAIAQRGLFITVEREFSHAPLADGGRHCGGADVLFSAQPSEEMAAAVAGSPRSLSVALMTPQWFEVASKQRHVPPICSPKCIENVAC